MATQLIGLLKIKVIRGVNLVVTDVASLSDPYVVITMHPQKLKTKYLRNNCNPEWNDVLTLAIYDVDIPVILKVYDKDTFSKDDEMGEAQIDIKPFINCVKASFDDLPDDTVVSTILPSSENCLAYTSQIIWKDGELVQHMILRLKNAATGEVEIQLGWVRASGTLRP